MPIINREKDASEQKDNYDLNFAAVTGVSALTNCLLAPCPQNIVSIQIAAFGISGSPVLNFQIQRFIAGVGNTIISGGFTSLAVGAAYGTSGSLAKLVPLSPGSSLLTQLLTNDVFQVVSSGANSAASYLGSVVCQTLGDYKSFYGV